MTDKTKTTLDWEKVAESSPTAYDALKKHCESINFAEFGTFEELISKPIEYLIGHLLAFFSSHDLLVGVIPVAHNNNRSIFCEIVDGPSFVSEPGITVGRKHTDDVSYPDYGQALAAAFTEAFRVLEEKKEEERV